MSFNLKDWQEVTLSEISVGGKGSYGIAASAVGYSKNLYTYLRITDISDDGVLNKSGLTSVDDPNAEKYLLKPNDIVFARTGNSTGRSYFYDGTDGLLVYAGFLIKFSLDPNKVNPKYMKYYTISNEYKNWVSSFSTGSTRGNINAQTYGNMKFKLPPREQQDFLVKILSIIDEKIEINNQINKKLEEMAKAIFKQWFVDFEFPNQNGEHYKSSGGEMVESELGMIPNNWKVGTFREYTDTVLGGDWGKENPQGNYTKEVYCLRGADIPEVREGKKGALPKRYILEKNYNNKKLSQGDLVVEISGGSPTQSTGRISYINEFMLNKYDADFVCTNFCRAITLNNKDVMEFFYFYWTHLYDLNIFFQYENGTTGIKNFDVNTFLDKFLIVKPPKEIIYKFHNVVESLLNTIQSNGSENIKLSETRDMLLPKLMSGEIRVPL